MALLLSGIMIVLLLLGFPMLVPLLAATVVGLLAYFPDVSPEVVIQQMIGGVKPSALIAVPMFILAAEIEHDALNLKAMHIQSGNTTLWRA